MRGFPIWCCMRMRGHKRERKKKKEREEEKEKEEGEEPSRNKATFVKKILLFWFPALLLHFYVVA